MVSTRLYDAERKAGETAGLEAELSLVGGANEALERAEAKNRLLETELEEKGVMEVKIKSGEARLDLLGAEIEEFKISSLAQEADSERKGRLWEKER